MSELINDVNRRATLVINTDGGSRGNPGPSAIGVVITTPDGQHLESFGKYLGEGTNNFAEYSGVIAGLEAAAKYQPKTIQFLLDSELVVKQLNGQYRVKHPDLQPLYHQVKALAEPYDVSFQHVLRGKNHLADTEVNKALDEAAHSAA
ncbi:MAG TPA: ribonuclease HI family protein [Candidatus Saccharimonadia bacterium]